MEIITKNKKRINLKNQVIFNKKMMKCNNNIIVVTLIIFLIKNLERFYKLKKILINH